MTCSVLYLTSIEETKDVSGILYLTRCSNDDLVAICLWLELELGATPRKRWREQFPSWTFDCTGASTGRPFSDNVERRRGVPDSTVSHNGRCARLHAALVTLF